MVVAAVRETRRPFIGLRSFEWNDSDLFFGREDQIERLLALLKENRFVSVIGESGTGKSSLVRAGLIPALMRAYGSGPNRKWTIAVTRPGTDPVGRLSQALAISFARDHEDQVPTELRQDLTGLLTEDTEPDAEIYPLLRQSSAGLVNVARERLTQGRRLLLVVDQFEELFAPQAGDSASPQERDARVESFVRLLLTATGNGELPIVGQEEFPIYVVLTMRAGFLGRCSRVRGLAEAMNRSLLLLPYLSRSQLREAIEGPVLLARGSIDPELLPELLSGLQERQDNLPVLQYLLNRMWGDDRRLSMESYMDRGGMDGVIERDAEAAYAESAKPDETILRKVFQRLVIRGTDGDVRRPSRVSELATVCGVESPVILNHLVPFLGLGLVVRTLDDDPKIDVPHESVIRQWARLQAWVSDEVRNAELYRRLATATKEGDRLEGKALLDTVAWRVSEQPNQTWADRYVSDEDGLFERSIRNLDRLRWRRRIGRLSIAAGAAAVVILSALSIGVYRVEQNRIRLQTAEDALKQAQADAANTALTANTRVLQAELGSKKQLETLQARVNTDTKKNQELMSTISAAQGNLRSDRADIQQDALQLAQKEHDDINRQCDLAEAYSALGGYKRISALDLCLRALGARADREDHRRAVDTLRRTLLACPGGFLSDSTADTLEAGSSLSMSPTGKTVSWTNSLKRARLWTSGSSHATGLSAIGPNRLESLSDSLAIGTAKAGGTVFVSLAGNRRSFTRPGTDQVSATSLPDVVYWHTIDTISFGTVDFATGKVDTGATLRLPHGASAIQLTEVAPGMLSAFGALVLFGGSTPKAIATPGNVLSATEHYAAVSTPEGLKVLRIDPVGKTVQPDATFRVPAQAPSVCLSQDDQRIAAMAKTADGYETSLISRSGASRRLSGSIQDNAVIQLYPNAFCAQPVGDAGLTYVWPSGSSGGAIELPAHGVFPPLARQAVVFFVEAGAPKIWTVEDLSLDLKRASETQLVRRAGEILRPFVRSGSIQKDW